MKITKTNIGAEDEVLCEDAPEIIIEHEGIKIVLRTLRGFGFITIITPEEDNGVRRTYMEHFGVTRIMQNFLKSKDES